MKKSYIFLLILIVFVISAIIISPQIYTASFSNGLLVWANILLPTLFPFLFFTKILTELGVINILTKHFTLTKKIFKTPPISAYAFVISILSGYPVGAKVVSDLYCNNSINKNDAFKICTFTSNSGPMFIYGTVGIGLFASKTIGLILLFSHITGAICNGILYCNHIEKKSSVMTFENKKIKKQFSIGDSMWDSIVSIFIIGGFVCIFFVIIDIFNNLNIFTFLSLQLSNIFSINSQIFNSIFNGMIEMTHGCLDITSATNNIFLSVTICAGLITFGGIATMVQAFVFLQKIGMRFSFFIKQKITHTIFSVIICLILLLIIY